MSQATEMVWVHTKYQHHHALSVRHGIKKVLSVFRHGFPRKIDKSGIIRSSLQGHCFNRADSRIAGGLGESILSSLQALTVG
jgi:hypothetical protein